MIDKLLNISSNIAYKIGDDSITYEDLYNKCKFYGDLLKREGISPVIIYGNKSTNFLVAMLSCIEAKRTYIPVNYDIPLNRLKEIINSSKTSLLITDNETLDLSIKQIKLDDLIDYKDNKIISNDNDVCYIIFTSGSTGKPKGVPISYDNLFNFISWINNFIDSKEIKKCFNTATFSFDLSVADIFYSLSNNITLESSKTNDLNDIFTVIYNTNLIVCTPSFLKLILMNNDFNESNYSNLKYVYCCGEVLSIDVAKRLFERFSNISLINAYGPTEATSAVCACIIEKDMLKQKELPIGNMNNVATKIEIINDVIVLSGKSVFKNYLGKEEFIDKYYTGDLGYIYKDYLYYNGRCDSQIKYMGYRIELSDIESNLLLINGINECVVVPNYYNDKINYLKCFYVGTNLSNEYIKEELVKYIPKYMIPKKFIRLEKIPLNTNNKIDRKKLINDEYM